MYVGKEKSNVIHGRRVDESIFAFNFAKYSFSSLIYTRIRYECTIIDESKFIRLENTSKSVKIEVIIDR